MIEVQTVDEDANDNIKSEKEKNVFIYKQYAWEYKGKLNNLWGNQQIDTLNHSGFAILELL